MKDKLLTSNSDAEEDVDGYLEPISMPMMNSSDSASNSKSSSLQKAKVSPN